MTSRRPPIKVEAHLRKVLSLHRQTQQLPPNGGEWQIHLPVCYPKLDVMQCASLTRSGYSAEASQVPVANGDQDTVSSELLPSQIRRVRTIFITPS